MLHAATVTTWSLLRQRVAWRHPEWWSLVLSMLAWFVLVVQSGTAPRFPHGTPSQVVDDDALWAAIGTWMLMVVAMMFPLVVGSIRKTAERSLWRRRHRAIGAFLTGYLASWVMVGAGVIALLASAHLNGAHHSPIFGAAGFAIAAVWQLTPIRRRALRACQRTMPLAPVGWRADADCVRFGCTIGARCVTTCWALMLACTLAGHSVPAMACVALVSAADRWVPGSPRYVTSAILVGVTLVHAAVASGLLRSVWT
jgi:predicted metal-binding membrane protein